VALLVLLAMRRLSHLWSEQLVWQYKAFWEIEQQSSAIPLICGCVWLHCRSKCWTRRLRRS
jgi:hypothetical protein